MTHEAKYTKAYYQAKLDAQKKRMRQLEKELHKAPTPDNCRAVNNLSIKMEFTRNMVDGFNDRAIASAKQKVINQLSN